MAWRMAKGSTFRIGQGLLAALCEHGAALRSSWRSIWMCQQSTIIEQTRMAGQWCCLRPTLCDPKDCAQMEWKAERAIHVGTQNFEKHTPQKPNANKNQTVRICSEGNLVQSSIFQLCDYACKRFLVAAICSQRRSRVHCDCPIHL
eukprot:1563033-Amphidinium_carterae.1